MTTSWDARGTRRGRRAPHITQSYVAVRGVLRGAVFPVVGAVLALLALAQPSDVAAHSSYLDDVPSTVGTAGCLTCHVTDGGGLTCCGDSPTSGCNDFCRNPFGVRFASQGHVWTADLARHDSDGDGWSNGQELGDPFHTWTLGDPTRTNRSAPGNVSSTPSINPCTTTGQNDCATTGGRTCNRGASTGGQFVCGCALGWMASGNAHERTTGHSWATNIGDRYSIRASLNSPACTDVNECTNPSHPSAIGPAPSCSEPGECVNIGSGGGYRCSCSPGRTCTLLNAVGQCARCEDGCTPGVHDCVSLPSFDVCQGDSNPDGYICVCPAGYTGNGRTGAGGTGCTNVNECASGDPCGIGAGRASACIDRTPHIDGARYACTCARGFISNGGDTPTCVDFDECAFDPDVPGTPSRCGPGGSCINALPPFPPDSWECECSAGCAGSAGWVSSEGPQPVCVDIDECLTPTLYCSTYAACTNAPGCFGCTCLEGFEGDGRTCEDIDECAEGYPNECDPRSTCENLLGSYRCHCNPGWEGSGVTCRDTDECALGTHGCGLNEVCVNRIGEPNDCVCASGYTRERADAPCMVRCGDGVRGQGEQCDDGNLDSGDGCDELCDVEPGWVCREPQPLLQSECSDRCGDGLIDRGEECDDGDDNSDTEPNACRLDCVRAHCGDGAVDEGEECDDGQANSDEARDGCRTTCHRAYCGDGVIDEGERCDPGGGVPGATVVGRCTTMCAADAGIDPNDPPALTGGACAASPSGGRSPAIVWLALVLGLALRARRRRR